MTIGHTLRRRFELIHMGPFATRPPVRIPDSPQEETHMFKPALVFAFVAALAASLVACSGGDTGDNTENAENADM
jgi:hypothetical protein